MNSRLKFITIFVNFIVPLAGLSTDIYLPSMPSMCHDFSLPSFYIQLTVTLFTLGMGLGQFFSGPVADSWGRKPLILIGLTMQIFCLFVIINTSLPALLIGARFFQGLGTAIMVVPVRAILSDCFKGNELKKQFTYITTSFAIGPIVAPFLGGYIQHYFGWRANFLFILIYALICFFAMLLVIPETLMQKTPLSLYQVKSRYTVVLTRHFFLPSVVLISLMMSFVAIFNVVGPFVIQNLLGYSAITSGYMALLSGVAWFLGNLTNRFFYRTHWQLKCKIVLPILFLISIIMIGLTFATLNLMLFMIPILFMLYFASILFPVIVAEVLSGFDKHAASANGLLFALVWSMFSFFSFIGALLKVHSIVPFAIVYSVMSALMILWYRLAMLPANRLS